MRKPAFCKCENKDADQLRGNREADQRLCFRHTDSTILLLSKSEISGLWPSSVAVQSGLCQTWSKPPQTGFLTTRLIYDHNVEKSHHRPVFSNRIIIENQNILNSPITMFINLAY